MASRSSRVLPRAVQLILINAVVGAGIGAIVAAALLSPAGVGLGPLIEASTQPWVAAALLFSGMMGTFAGLAAGTAIMLAASRQPNNHN
jgi:hypothetical protein